MSRGWSMDARMLALAAGALGMFVLLAGSGCSDRAIVAGDAGYDSGRRDAGGGGFDAGRDAGGPPDAGADAGNDAGTDAGEDAGPNPIVIDGVLRAGEWDPTACVTNSVASAWSGANQLEQLCAIVRGPNLYVAIEGQIEPVNAIVVYVDHELGALDGVADLASLTDSTGDLDDSVSAGFTTPTAFRADVAWGARDMAHTAVDFDPRMGWREITGDVSNFSWVTATEAPSACGASACETRIALSRLGGATPGTIALFARIVNGSGMMSPNQCLPEDDASMPRVVSALMRVMR